MEQHSEDNSAWNLEKQAKKPNFSFYSNNLCFFLKCTQNILWAKTWDDFLKAGNNTYS